MDAGDILSFKRMQKRHFLFQILPVLPDGGLFFPSAFFLRASFLAMHRAVDQLSTRPEHLLIDGNRFNKYPGIPHTTVIKGDGKYLSIAAASILAKTYRDDYMNRLHEEYPYYDWNRNKGYPTKKHRAAIAEHGTTPYHRMTFNLLGGEQLSLDF